MYLYEFKVIHSSQRWKSILFEFSFIAQEVKAITKKSTSTINKVNQIFNLLISSINDILTMISEIEAYGNMISSYFNSTTPNNTVNFAHKTIPHIKNNTVPLLRNTATVLYNNCKPENYTNYYFENQKVDYDKFTELTPYTNNLDNSSINALLEVYNTHIQNNINQINNYGLNIQANNLIIALKNSYVNLVDIAKNLTLNNSSQYTSYSLPYTMSIR